MGTPVRSEETPRFLASDELRLALGVVAALAVAAFLPVLDNGFVSWDDGQNFLRNPAFRGLSWESLAWGWHTRLMGVFQPLGWWLFSAEYELFRLRPMGYHFVSLAFHILNSLLVFLVAHRVAGLARDEDSANPGSQSVLAAALAAAFFAAHPLRAEVVAWTSCQPYLPCVSLMLLAALFHLRGGLRRRTPRELAVVYLLGLGALLFKAAAVSLPVLLLLLDFYPLRRLRGPEGKRAWLEKLPLFALSALFSGIAASSRGEFSGLVSVDSVGLTDRLLQAGQGVWFYFGRALLPLHLAPLYPVPPLEGAELGTALFATLALLAVTGLAFARRRRWPGLLAVWLAYLAILAPHLGLIRLGHTFLADRYTYLATIPWAVGLAVLLIRTGLLAKTRVPATLSGAAILLGALAWLARGQAATWADDEHLWKHAEASIGRPDPAVSAALGSLYLEQGAVEDAIREFRQAIALYPPNPKEEHNLGVALKRQGKYDEAVTHFTAALPIADQFPEVRVNLGIVLLKLGRLDEAAARLAEALQAQPNLIEARILLAEARCRQGKLEDALRGFSLEAGPGPRYPLSYSTDHEAEFDRVLEEHGRAVLLRPARAQAFVDFGSALLDLNKRDEAISVFTLASAIDPKLAAARFALGTTLVELGELDRAIREFHLALERDPASSNAHNNLGTALAQRERYADAAEQFRLAIAANPKSVKARNNLGAAYAKLGKRREAGREFARAHEADPNSIETLYNLGTFYAEDQQYAESAKLFEHALRLQPGYTKVRANYGAILARQKKYPEAAAEYERVLVSEPGNYVVRVNLSEILRKLGKIDEAARQEAEARRYAPNPR